MVSRLMINLYEVETINSNETKLHIILRLKKNSVDGVNWFLLGFVLSFDKFFYSKIFSPILFFLNPNRWLTFEYFVT